ncbi:MAG: hypothetical protein A2017_01180 [Lentisphaerae bacterium GWF2_44_16]|nr:MAG: hypothetical protein A2017_01180 [Lentisphaerae bacterium GWF2_44_16]
MENPEHAASREISASSEEAQSQDSVFQKEGSERLTLENELRYTKDYLENLLQALPSSLISVRCDGTVIHWNKIAEKFTGIQRSEAAGRIIWDILGFLCPYKPDFERAISSMKAEELRGIEYSEGDGRYLDIAIYPASLAGSNGAVIKIDDVTEQQKKDEYLRQAQKMDTVGNLAAGLAHDFNNVIGAIGATVSSIRFSLDFASDLAKLKKELKNDLDIVEDSVKHGTDMVEQLRGLGKKKEQPLSFVNLKEIVEGVVRICRNTFPKTIEINMNFYTEDKAVIKAYPTQMNQALLNLCVNASHAMTIMRKESEKQGGTLSVSLEKVSPGKHFSAILPGAYEGDYWLLRVWDTGIGMEQQTMKKIFDPFFTTKDKNKGTGLGLSMVFNIIQQHKGFIEVYSEPGNGSVFNVFLPAADEKNEGGLENKE